jgi:signal transduction histidine kinase
MRESPNLGLPLRLLWPPVILLIVGLLLTLGAAVTTAQTSRARSALRFDAATAEARAAIDQRVQIHVSLLRGVAGYMASGVEVDRERFRRYIERLDLTNSYPGVEGVGFSARVRPEDRAALEGAVRSWGQPEFRLWPDGPRDETHAIILLEPLNARNRRALGFNMFSEPARRAAMERARDTGVAAASGAVRLVQEQGEIQPQSGFLIYVPVYAGGGLPTGVDARREQLLGFAYSPFRADDLLRGIFADRDRSEVAFAIYDGSRPDAAALLHRSPHLGGPNYRPAFTASETLNVAGRPWTILYSSQPAFDASGDAYVAPLAAVVGALLSLMVFGIAWGQARARHEAELAVRARETFLSIASHELKTPLTALYGNAQLLERRARQAGALGEREQANIQVIVEQSRRLTRLMDDLLDHTRLQEGRLTIAHRPLELAALVQRVADDMRPTLTRHTLSVHLPDEPLSVQGDELRLDQVFINLLGNAVKYSPAGGPVEVTVARDGAYATVAVVDHGIGIPDAALPQLFSPFFRAPNAVSKHISGMGIGLFVVKELVELHGGSLAVASEEGVGSTFTVALPLTHQPDPPAPRQP